MKELKRKWKNRKRKKIENGKEKKQNRDLNLPAVVIFHANWMPWFQAGVPDPIQRTENGKMKNAAWKKNRLIKCLSYASELVQEKWN